MSPSMERFLGTIVDVRNADDEDEPGRTDHGVDGEASRTRPPSVTRQKYTRLSPLVRHSAAAGCQYAWTEAGRVGLKTRRIARPVRSDRDAIAAEKEQASDQGTLCGRARKVRVDQRVPARR